MYELYYSPDSASFAVHWMLMEIDAPYVLRRVDLAARAHKAPDYLRLNPDGLVPTLLIDGQPRKECAALLLTLADTVEAAGAAAVHEVQEKARASIEQYWRRIDGLLSDGRRHSSGVRLTALDLLVTMLMRFSRKMPKPATGCPAIFDYVQGMRAMPSFKAAYAREGLTEWA